MSLSLISFLVYTEGAAAFLKRTTRVYSMNVEGGEEKMRSKLKVATIALVTIAVASALLYMPLTIALQSGEEEVPEGVRCGQRPRLRARLAWRFLNHSEPVEIEGTVVTLFKNMLIVDTAEERIRIHLPPQWNVDEEVMPRAEFYESYLSVGEEITVEALRANVIDKEGLCIYLLLAYEIINEGGAHAYAVLPFNIET